MRSTKIKGTVIKATKKRGIQAQFLQVWRHLHWLSLDVAVGASASSAWIGERWDAPPSQAALGALFCGALWVYSVDHWADTRAIQSGLGSRLSPRRNFLWRFRCQLLLIALCSAMLGFIFSLYLPRELWMLGSLCLGMCALYLWRVQQSSRLCKEAVIACMYTIALSLWPLSRLFVTLGSEAHSLHIAQGIIGTLFIGCLAWANLCLISTHELKSDQVEGVRSIASYLGVERARALGIRALYLAGGAELLLALSHPRETLWRDVLIGGLMIITLAFLYASPTWSSTNERYRLYADLIFLYPLIIHIY